METDAVMLLSLLKDTYHLVPKKYKNDNCYMLI